STDYHPCASNPVGTPCVGNGMFYLNSWIRDANIRDGNSNTMLAGERRSNPSVSPAIYGTWIGAPPGGVESIGRVLGVADYAPNDPFNHFEAYSSNHPGGAQVLLCDGSVQFIASSVDIQLFMGLATINKHDNAIVFVPQ
ncbi:MAG TPA: DUF1559 domain-containing protein, partial [Planctomycetaceae bacterium]|nr:DUF1559 domain-containing protein [Planctomycetaceae bacterium]